MTTLLRRDAVLTRIGLTPGELKSLLRTGRFPQPVLIGAKVELWPDADITKWIDARIKEREAGIVPPERLALIESRREGGRKRAASR